MIELQRRAEDEMRDQGRRRGAEERVALLLRRDRDLYDLAHVRVGGTVRSCVEEECLAHEEVEAVTHHPHLGRAGLETSLAVIPPIGQDTGTAVPERMR